MLAGLNALPDLAADTIVAVHDAARPCFPCAALDALFARADAHPVGAIWAQPMLDTVKRANQAGEVAQTLDRTVLWRAQTPQVFRFAALREAMALAQAEGAVITDESQAMERCGLFAAIVPCPVENPKLTRAGDLPQLLHFLSSSQTPAA
ncbi:hypothetical protein HC761_00885 [bacterium]|nr:hypothetical protein [bacterium]